MVFQERTYAVLIVSASDKFIQGARSLLPPTDYWPVESAQNAGEARRRMLETVFDLVLIQSPLRDEFGSRLAMVPAQAYCCWSKRNSTTTFMLK